MIINYSEQSTKTIYTFSWNLWSMTATDGSCLFGARASATTMVANGVPKVIIFIASNAAKYKRHF